jgi:hypothetical protein
VRAHPARRVLHIGGHLTPFPSPSSCRCMPWPSVTTVRSSPPLDAAASTLPRRSDTVQLPSPRSASAPHHGNALGAHLAASMSTVSPHHPRHHVGHSRGDHVLRGRRAPRPQLARPASGPHAPARGQDGLSRWRTAVPSTVAVGRKSAQQPDTF